MMRNFKSEAFFEFDGQSYKLDMSTPVETLENPVPALGSLYPVRKVRLATNLKTGELIYVSYKKAAQYVATTYKKQMFTKQSSSLKAFSNPKTSEIKSLEARLAALRAAPHINNEGTIIVPLVNRKLPLMLKPAALRELFERQDEIKPFI